MIQTEREFSKLCAKRGFARLAPRYYARCIGDGVFQIIYTGFRKYIHIDSPNYSAQKRKDYYISIGLRSLYSRYHEEDFIPGKDPGGYGPADLKIGGKYTGIFNGIEEEYGIMEQIGFDVLDTINTQEALLEWWSKVEISSDGIRIHDLRLIEPFLLCGQRYEAEIEISISYIQGMDAYYAYLARVDAGIQQRYLPYEQRIRESAERKMTFWKWCMGRKYKEFSRYLDENYKQNMAWARQYGIPTDQCSQQRYLLEATFSE